MTETFKPIKGYEGRYSVSAEGYVIYDGPVVKYRTGMPKKTCIDPHGYVRVTLRRNGKSVQKLLHHLVAEAFLDKPVGAYLVDHINGDRADNRLENLRWTDQSTNQLNRFKVVAKSGAVGVHKIKGSAINPWMALGKIKGKIIYLGVFPTFDQAVTARAAWETSVNSTTTSNTRGTHA